MFHGTDQFAITQEKIARGLGLQVSPEEYLKQIPGYEQSTREQHSLYKVCPTCKSMYMIPKDERNQPRNIIAWKKCQACRENVGHF